MSIQPAFAEAVFSHAKQFEYRRCVMGLKPGDVVFVYETQPVSSVTGEFRAGDLVTGSPESLSCLEHDDEMRQKVRTYLKGSTRCSALKIEEPKRWPTPIRLEQFLGGVVKRAPQSYAFLKLSRDELLRSSAPTA